MRSIIFAITLTCSSISALANQCNLEFDGQLQLENNVLLVQMDKNNTLKITEDKALYVNGELISLSPEQQNWVNQYYAGISDAAPQVANIASEAIALAGNAVNEVFTELLGADNRIMEDLSEKLDDLDKQIQYNFYAEDGSIRLNSAAFEDGEFIDEQWEQEFEAIIEEVVSESIGHLMIALGTQIIFGGGDMHEFEQKMERLGQQIEHKVDYQATALEQKAETLCHTLGAVDFAENQLQRNVHQLAKLNILQVNKGSNLM